MLTLSMTLTTIELTKNSQSTLQSLKLATRGGTFKLRLVGLAGNVFDDLVFETQDDSWSENLRNLLEKRLLDCCDGEVVDEVLQGNLKWTLA